MKFKSILSCICLVFALISKYKAIKTKENSKLRNYLEYEFNTILFLVLSVINRI